MRNKLKRKYNILKRQWIDSYLMRGWRFLPKEKSSIVVESTNICSLRCTCCPNGIDPHSHRLHGIMSRETFDSILNNFDVPLKSCFLHMCGEPFINKNLCYFVEKLLERKITPIIFSNGYQIDYGLLCQLLDYKGVRISFSMDLISRQHYDRIRVPGDYDRSIESLKKINSIFTKKNRYFGLNVIISADVVDNLEDACAHLFEQYSNLVRITLSSMWPWPGYPQSGDLAGHLSSKGTYCSRAKDLPVILWNGNASFCSFDYKGELIVGDAKKQKLSKIYNSVAARRVRRNIFALDFQNESLCSKCLFPRYESLSQIVLRNYKTKLSEQEREILFYSIKEYYGRGQK